MFNITPCLSTLKQLFLISVIPVILYSCGTIPTSDLFEEKGSIIVKTQIIQSLSKKRAVLESTFDSLVVEINGADFNAPIHWSTPINSSLPVITDTVPSIPSGPSRTVKIWTVNKKGVIIHRDSIPSHTVSINPGAVTSINVVLLPAVGSIFLQIGNIPTSIDSIQAVFTSNDGETWQTAVRRSTRVYIAIDAIPHMTKGTLSVETYNSSGEVVNKAESDLQFNAFNKETVSLDFSSSGTAISKSGLISFTTTIYRPGATVASASLGASNVATDENGQCIISEIMFSANDSEYIEIYNPGTITLNYDTLILEIDGTQRMFEDVSIPSKDYYVFGRKAFPWVDKTHKTLSALNLSSNGNWITLKAGNQILDQVIFSEGNKGLEWPIVKGKKSIELLLSSYSPIENNFGRNWICSNSLIKSTTHLYGSPGF